MSGRSGRVIDLWAFDGATWSGRDNEVGSCPGIATGWRREVWSAALADGRSALHHLQPGSGSPGCHAGTNTSFRLSGLPSLLSVLKFHRDHREKIALKSFECQRE